MRHSGKGSGGGLGMNKVVHRPHGKTEPRPHARNPARVAQYGQMQSSHITHGKESSYRGEPDFTRSGYSPPVGPTSFNNIGPGGGRTIYEHGTQCQTGTNPGNPRPNTYREALEQE